MRLTNFIRVVAFAICGATVTVAQAADISGRGRDLSLSDLRQMGRHL